MGRLWPKAVSQYQRRYLPWQKISISEQSWKAVQQVWGGGSMRRVFHQLAARMDAGKLFALKNEAFFSWVEMEKEGCNISTPNCSSGSFLVSQSQWINFQVIILSLTLQQALQSLHSDRTNANITNISCSLEFSYTGSESKSAQLQHSELNAMQTLEIPFTWIPDTNSCNGLHSAPLTHFKSLLPAPTLEAGKILELP